MHAGHITWSYQPRGTRSYHCLLIWITSCAIMHLVYLIIYMQSKLSRWLYCKYALEGSYQELWWLAVVLFHTRLCPRASQYTFRPVVAQMKLCLPLDISHGLHSMRSVVRS